MQITEAAPVSNSTNRAQFVVPEGQEDAIFEANGKTYRLVQIHIVSNGLAWTWAAQQTKKGADYQSGMGITMVLDQRSTAFTAVPSATWGAMVKAANAALELAGWFADSADDHQCFIYTRRGSAVPTEDPSPRQILMAHSDVSYIGPRSEESAVVEATDDEAGTVLVGFLTGDTLLTGLPDMDGYVEVPAEYVDRYIERLLEWAAKDLRVGTTHDRSNAILTLMNGDGDPEAPMVSTATEAAQRVAELEQALSDALQVAIDRGNQITELERRLAQNQQDYSALRHRVAELEDQRAPLRSAARDLAQYVLQEDRSSARTTVAAHRVDQLTGIPG